MDVEKRNMIATQTPELAHRIGHMRAWLREETQGHVLSLIGLPNRPEILYRLSAVLYAHDWYIHAASIRTGSELEIEDRFQVSPIDIDRFPDPERFSRMIEDYSELLNSPSSVHDYLIDNGKQLHHAQTGKGEITFARDPIRIRLRVSAPDRPGLLLSILHLFAMMHIDVLTAEIETDADGMARNIFLVNPGDERFERKPFRTLLADALKVLL